MYQRVCKWWSLNCMKPYQLMLHKNVYILFSNFSLEIFVFCLFWLNKRNSKSPKLIQDILHHKFYKNSGKNFICWNEDVIFHILLSIHIVCWSPIEKASDFLWLFFFFQNPYFSVEMKVYLWLSEHEMFLKRFSLFLKKKKCFFSYFKIKCIT